MINQTADLGDRTISIEQSLLGGILNDERALSAAANIVSPADFMDPVHAKIFETCLEVQGQGAPVNVVTVTAFLGKVELPNEMRPREYLARLVGECNSGRVATNGFARMIRELSKARKLVALCSDAAAIARNPLLNVKPATIAGDLVSALDEIASEGLPPSLRAMTIGEAGRRALAAAIEAKLGKPSRGITTGIPDLDAVVGGLERGEGSILAGRPSMGKTALAVSMAHNAAASGVGVVYFSHEMGGESLAMRALSSMSFFDGVGPGIPYSNIRRGRFQAADEQRLDRASCRLEKLPFVIDPQPGLNVAQMAARARNYRKRLEVDGFELGLIIVDHIGLVGASSRYAGDRVREIGEVSAGIHAVARELDCHAMMLSQLSRAIESRADKHPQLHDLRESGELEQNADLVMGVYREAYYLERSANAEDALRLPMVANDLDVGILKNRNGATRTVPLFIDIACNAVTGKHQGALAA